MPAPAPGQPRRIFRALYAEDVPELRELMRIVLTTEGHTAECVPDGLAAWEKIQVEPGRFDLIITDHHMPKMTGLDLVTRLRTTDYAGRIIVFSSELSPEVGQAYRQLKVDVVLPKPIFPVTLRAVLATL
ncbi:MAG TPA: response regulator [Lacunisphaera sp.]|nr:response regulator [Lacunisphaera sp.]